MNEGTDASREPIKDGTDAPEKARLQYVPQDYNPVIADIDYWIRNNCASWSTEAVIMALVHLGYVNQNELT
jgi:hypothetical protein